MVEKMLLDPNHSMTSFNNAFLKIGLQIEGINEVVDNLTFFKISYLIFASQRVVNGGNHLDKHAVKLIFFHSDNEPSRTTYLVSPSHGVQNLGSPTQLYQGLAK